MKVLELNNGKSSFLIEEKHIAPEALSRKDLLYILNKIYEDETDSIEIPQLEELEGIKNPIEKEIVQQIIQKMAEFKNNVENIRQEVQSQFPPIKN
ncbi:hypothetical protein [Enterococcus faecalis]|uniref:hypothetical protein n=1 Tax=Enterococcus faecalis TaxID=1351 RepID=UPI0019FA5365|nr:hypothetical protein [Enterococcus faecalis]EGO7681660.1 hypothetical protein [Enterococcus faecalis]EJX8002579.1 hypothetical protein [Enterococcus faecalis]MDK4410067.1 hypothetical protein [Enterococcus faecalis]MEB5892129.1 hypothetical protein [Enterococcus faecalis]